MATTVLQPDLTEENHGKAINQLSTDIQLTAHRTTSLFNAIRAQAREVEDALALGPNAKSDLIDLQHGMARILDFTDLATIQVDEIEELAERVEKASRRI